MLSYPYIENLFTAILAQSEAIKGRFFIAPYWASELNSNNLEQLVDASMGANKQVKTYPLALMMPPVSSADYGETNIRDSYRITMFFLKQTGITSSGAVQAMSQRTGHTTHRVVEDWHDMKRCAVSFVRATTLLVREKNLGQLFYISQKAPQNITPITGMSTDKLAGVKLDMTCIMALGCTTEDYPEDYLTMINLPSADSHPQHPL